jgi:gamma-glutamylcyclotransferase (GGCT)/AIG2-like uncharacterized protein YtfP
MTNAAPMTIFVYGSLRSGFRSPAYEYISRYFDLVSEGKVKGALYDMGDYPAAVASDSGDLIAGELYQVKNMNEFAYAMAQLDDYEGVHPEAGEQQLFKREQTEVLISGTWTPAWIYWYNGDVTGRPKIPSGDLMDYVQGKK